MFFCSKRHEYEIPYILMPVVATLIDYAISSIISISVIKLFANIYIFIMVHFLLLIYFNKL